MCDIKNTYHHRFQVGNTIAKTHDQYLAKLQMFISFWRPKICCNISLQSDGLTAQLGLSESRSQAQAFTRPSPGPGLAWPIWARPSLAHLGSAQPGPWLKAEPCTSLAIKQEVGLMRQLESQTNIVVVPILDQRRQCEEYLNNCLSRFGTH